jgi:hypothetical protein
MALECGFDAGFGVGTKPSDVASYIVEEYLRRNKSKAQSSDSLASMREEEGNLPEKEDKRLSQKQKVQELKEVKKPKKRGGSK